MVACFEKRMAGHPKFKIEIIASNGGPTACGNPMSGHLWSHALYGHVGSIEDYQDIPLKGALTILDMLVGVVQF